MQALVDQQAVATDPAAAACFAAGDSIVEGPDGY